MNNLIVRFNKLKNAFDSLNAMAQEPQQQNRANVDATIKRFEYTFELFWKTLKILLEKKEGIIIASPKGTLKESYACKLIDNEAIWIDMLDDRNQTSHTYNEELADQIYERIKIYIPILQDGVYRLASEIEHLKD